MSSPPALIEELLRRLLRHTDHEAVLGDLAEVYRARCATAPGKASAVSWYCREAALVLLLTLGSEVVALFRRVPSNRRKVMGHPGRMVTAGATVVLNAIAAAVFWVTGLALVQL